jgi:hypothetical protein
MNLKLALLLAGALVVGGVFVTMKSEDAGDEEAALLGERDERVSSSRGERRILDSSEKALRFLRSVPEMDLDNAPSFAEIQGRTGDLTLEQIEELLAANESHEGLSGWLRSALWAELGRRNDRATFERLLSSAGSDETGGASFANDQALFAFIRGRSESLKEFDDSVDVVIEDIGTLAAKSNSGHWRSKAVSELFEKLAKLDHEAAWELVQEPCLNEQLRAEVPGLFDNNQTAATTGFFRALSSEKLVRDYLGEWERVLELPEVRKNYESYRFQIDSSLSGFIAIPPEEVIISNALASLARFDPEAAVAWLAEHEPDPEKPDYNRIHGMWRALAENYPERALEIFGEEKYLDARRMNIGGVLEKDFSLVPEVITGTPKASHQVQILQSVMSSAGSAHVNDFFPTPEGPNRLPNFQERYDFLLEGIHQGAYPERQREQFLERLEQTFEGKLGGSAGD